jgi:RecA-family ATPase
VFDFLVEGWLPRGSVTVMGATGGTGKSSLAHRLAIMASMDWREDEQPKWLGMPLHKDRAKGVVIYFSGEDSAAIVNARASMVDPEGRSSRLMLQRNDFGLRPDGKKASIGDFLQKLRRLPDVSLVVIDPARKYLEGDEDDSEVVSNFFEAIEEFAVEKNCGMVVVHHLVKNAHPRDTRDIYDLLRGSQVFIDRPRAVIGMMREGPYTVVGLSKNNIPPNLGSIQGERLFVRDPDRLDLVLLPGKEGIRLFDVTADELREIREKAERSVEG